MLPSLFAALLSLVAVQPGGPATREECAVLAEVAERHYPFGEAASPPLLPGRGYLPACPWSELGVRITPEAPEKSNRWLRFERPRIEGRRAIVRTGVMYGRLSGHGAVCELVKRGGVWRLRECRRTGSAETGLAASAAVPGHLY